ncbi:hypothetical protein ANN_00642 [Periplaneta americana]|uniref:Uncharacterized protein n=1 Tax=Periplaneta americana TaxID=6978 RepID=A0ABQ8TRD5_PERAM|nr:hypothetical protein ANN_00642 [Periplaneta americana]
MMMAQQTAWPAELESDYPTHLNSTLGTVYDERNQQRSFISGGNGGRRGGDTDYPIYTGTKCTTTKKIEHGSTILDRRQRQTIEWHHANSPKKQKFKSTPSAGNVMATVFFDSEGLLLVYIMPHGTTIQVRLSRVRRHREKQDVLLLHDNAQPYVSHKTTDQITKFG